MTTVAVIIPCYRDSYSLARALDSVLAQSRMPDEIIVVNDASPETAEIEAVLVAYQQIKYIVNPQNLGLAATRNIGVAAASSSIVSFLDADDELHPQKIELQLSLYRPDQAISCRVARIRNERGIDHVVRYDCAVKYSVLKDSSRLVSRNALTGASLMISRELFLSLGGYDENLRSCEDFDLWLRLLDKGVFVFNVELPLYLYRINESGLSRNLLNISYWEMEVVKKYYERHSRAGVKLFGEAVTKAIWLFRHFVRYEECRDPKLMEATHRNLELLRNSPFIRIVLIFAQQIGIARLVGFFRRLGGLS